MNTFFIILMSFCLNFFCHCTLWVVMFLWKFLYSFWRINWVAVLYCICSCVWYGWAHKHSRDVIYRLPHSSSTNFGNRGPNSRFVIKANIKTLWPKSSPSSILITQTRAHTNHDYKPGSYSPKFAHQRFSFPLLIKQTSSFRTKT